MPIINFSPTFNLDYYRDAHPELNLCNDDELTAHYERFADRRGCRVVLMTVASS